MTILSRHKTFFPWTNSILYKAKVNGQGIEIISACSSLSINSFFDLFEESIHTPNFVSRTWHENPQPIIYQKISLIFHLCTDHFMMKHSLEKIIKEKDGKFLQHSTLNN